MNKTLVYEGRDLEAMVFAQNYHAWIRDIFKPYLGARVAEVGAGSGNFSELLLNTDVKELVTVEPSNEMFPLLEKKFRGKPGVSVRKSFFGDIRSEYRNYFNAIVYVNVLEHIEDDAAELRYMYESLQPGGHACIFVPALPFLYSKTDKTLGHFRRYKKQELATRMTDAGFEIKKISYLDILGIPSWYLFLKIMQKELSGNDVAFYDRFVVPVMRRIESRIPMPLGKNLVAVGRRR
jgi:SAM-dependent methyltransferase